LLWKTPILSSLMVVMALVLSGGRAGAQIQSLSGNNLYRFCTADTPDANLAWGSASLCMGYITAIRDIMANGSPLFGKKACIPATVDMGQIVDIVKNEIHSHPESRHLPAAMLVSKAFANDFPCR
jgi:Rap1a immunity proteins